jgi:hypothetical protein
MAAKLSDLKIRALPKWHDEVHAVCIYTSRGIAAVIRGFCHMLGHRSRLMGSWNVYVFPHTYK